jgi:exopolyphosphatase/pppGpp-phosphohydrolase
MRLRQTVLVLLLFFAASTQAATRYFGAIDLGSKGTKATLYAFVPSSEGVDTKVEYQNVINTKLVSSMANGSFTPEGIADATRAVSTLLGEMHKAAEEKKLTDVTYYVVGSSGVARSANKAELVAAVKKATDADLEFVDAAQEGFFGLVAAVPLRRRPVSLIVDVGSGNTKIGCLVGTAEQKNFAAAELPFGSVSGRNAALQKSPGDLAEGVRKVMAEDVAPAYVKKSYDAPCLQNRSRIFWSGGAAWATATLLHPETVRDAYVELTGKELADFITRLKDGSWNKPDLVFHFSSDVGPAARKSISESAKAEQAKVFDVFTGGDLLAGVSIMRTVLESSNPKASIFFARNSNYIYGYALAKFKEEQAAEAAATH